MGAVVRRTSIICTIGPKTKSVEMLSALRDAGMNVARMNFSHGSYEYHGEVHTLPAPCQPAHTYRGAGTQRCCWQVVDNVRKIPTSDSAQGVTTVVAIALDTKGPEIRTGMMEGGTDVTLVKDSKVRLTAHRARNEGQGAGHSEHRRGCARGVQCQHDFRGL